MFEHLGKDNSGTFNVPRATYQNVVDAFGANFPGPEPGKWLRIDHALAETLARELH